MHFRKIIKNQFLLEREKWSLLKTQLSVCQNILQLALELVKIFQGTGARFKVQDSGQNHLNITSHSR